MLIRNGKVYRDGKFDYQDVRVENDRIVEILPIDSKRLPGEQEIDLVGGYLVPGFIDLQVHGAAGYDFSDATPEALEAIAHHLAKHGVTSYLAASDSFPTEVLEEAFTNAKDFVGKETGGAVLRGIHMMGPFVEKEHRGFQDERYLRDPDAALFEHLNECSGGTVKIVDVSPELPGARDFARAASKTCFVSLGHSGADFDTARMVYSYGARMATDLFTEMPMGNAVEPGLLGAASDIAQYVTLPISGDYPHPSVIRLAYQIFNDRRLCLVSNMTAFSGLRDDTYLIDNHTVTVALQRATFEDGRSAGSMNGLDDSVFVAAEFGGIPLPRIINTLTETPAKVLGIFDEVGSIEPGKRADITVLDLHNLYVRRVFIGGKQVYEFTRF